MTKTGQKILSALIFAALISASHSTQAQNNKAQNWKKSLKLVALDQLEFGTIAPSSNFDGYVEVSPNQNNSSICSHNLTCLYGGSRARFRITGRRHQGIYITLPNQVILRNQAGQTMIADNFQYYASGFGQGIGYINGNGAIELGVGAQLNVQANQMPGAYQGTFEVTVSYQ